MHLGSVSHPLSAAYYEQALAMAEQRLGFYSRYGAQITPLQNSSAFYRELFARNLTHIESCESQIVDLRGRLAQARARESGE